MPQSAESEPRPWRPPDLSQPRPRDGYRFSTDAFVLASFAAAFQPRTWCDLGAGSGVIAYTLACRFPTSRGVAIERQRASLVHARANLRGLPALLIEGDLRRFPWRADRFDLAVCNPPYYEVDAGHINRNPVIAEARHTFHGNVVDFAAAILPALRPGGRFCFILPHILHRPVLQRLRQSGWRLERSLALRPYAGREPRLTCFALTRDPVAEPTRQDLIQFQAHRVFTRQMERFLSGRGDWRRDL